MATNMNDLQKAQSYITDKNHSLTKTAEMLNVALGTLAGYRGNPKKLENAAWIKVHALAELYDKEHTDNKEHADKGDN